MENRSYINILGGTITGENLGIDCGIYSSKNNGNNLQYKSLIAGTGISLSANTSAIIMCSTGGGGITWSGSTANGLATYVNSSKVYSNPNITFSGTVLNQKSNIEIGRASCRERV